MNNLEHTETSKPRLKPWERGAYDKCVNGRWIRESARAYEAFLCYLQLGPQRSLTKVAQKLNKNRTFLGGVSSRWHWVERAEAYDREVAGRALEEQNRKRLAKLSEAFDLHDQGYERKFNAAINLLNTALSAMETLRAGPFVEKRKDGAVVTAVEPSMVKAWTEAMQAAAELLHRSTERRLSYLGFDVTQLQDRERPFGYDAQKMRFFEHPNPEVRRLARDLALALADQSGDNGNASEPGPMGAGATFETD